MAGRKRRPVLYEVVSRSRRRSGFTWWTGARSGADDGEKPAATTPSAGAESPPPAPPTQSSAPRPLRTTVVGRARRVELTLGWPHLAGAAIVLLVLVYTVFQIGALSTRPSVPPEQGSEALTGAPGSTPENPGTLPRNNPAASHRPTANSVAPAPGGPRPSPREQQPTPPPATQNPPPEKRDATGLRDLSELQSGLYYVVVQHFPKSASGTAIAARDYLRQGGVKCDVYQGRGDLMLIAADVFRDVRETRDLIQRVRTLGAEYFRGGGGYDFAGTQARKF